MGLFPRFIPARITAGRIGPRRISHSRGLLRAERRTLSGTLRPRDRFVPNALTTWSFEPAVVFGGVNGAPEKRIDAIVSTHGFPVSPGTTSAHQPRAILLHRTLWPYAMGGLEARGRCFEACNDLRRPGRNGLSRRGFQVGAMSRLERSRCLRPSEAAPPMALPRGELALGSAFRRAGRPAWRRAPLGTRETLPTEPSPNLERQRTRVTPRTRRASTTSRSVAAGGNAIPIRRCSRTFQLVGYRSAKRWTTGSAGSWTETRVEFMHVELSQRDSAGRELWSTSFDAAVPTEARGVKPKQSIYLASSVFMTTSPPIRIEPGAVSLRLSFTPETPGLFDILDASLMPR